MTRGKLQLQTIQNPVRRRITFSKRKAGLLKKASELALLCDAEVALLIFSPSGNLYEFGSPSMNRIIGKYLKGCDSTGCPIQLPEYVEPLRLEFEDLRRQITQSEKVCKHMIGEDLDLLNLKELQQLEKKMSLGARRIRSRKEKLFRLEKAELD
ncbi:MADS-box transcription factor 14 isoform X3 [Cryptomeria japonica]|uniref:MADS-box transcription factor 14 isoform X3 n=1 Tax=Cryptomeria japonica TaxID=3369 RepID=UPI0027D9E5E3|nr:MADS-box transcription factor 14 isoform X3 [Cryptomeria japonica]